VIADALFDRLLRARRLSLARFVQEHKHAAFEVGVRRDIKHWSYSFNRALKQHLLEKLNHINITFFLSRPHRCRLRFFPHLTPQNKNSNRRAALHIYFRLFQRGDSSSPNQHFWRGKMFRSMESGVEQPGAMIQNRTAQADSGLYQYRQ
jgi:hypothetical protein